MATKMDNVEPTNKTVARSRCLDHIWELITRTFQLNEEIKFLIKDYFQTFEEHHRSLLKMMSSWHRHVFRNPAQMDDSRFCLYVDTHKFILETFQGLESRVESPSKDVKLASFKLLNKIDGVMLIQAANQIFEYDSNPEDFVDAIKKLAKKRKYELAAQWVTFLKLCDHFILAKIALPLILRNEMRQLIDYLKVLEKAQITELLILCDTICKTQQHFLIECQNLDIPDVKVEKARHLIKTVDRLSSRFKVSTDFLPNLKKWKEIFVVDDLVHSHYERGKYIKKDFEDLLKEIVQDDFILQLEALSLIVDKYNDEGQAYNWCVEWNTNMAKLPEELSNSIKIGKEKPFKNI